jgi:hypothetical protein
MLFFFQMLVYTLFFFQIKHATKQMKNCVSLDKAGLDQTSKHTRYQSQSGHNVLSVVRLRGKITNEKNTTMYTIPHVGLCGIHSIPFHSMPCHRISSDPISSHSIQSNPCVCSTRVCSVALQIPCACVCGVAGCMIVTQVVGRRARVPAPLPCSRPAV